MLMQTQQGFFGRADVFPTLAKAWPKMFKQEAVANAMRKVLSREIVVGSASTDRIAMDAPAPSAEGFSLTPASVAFTIKAAQAAAKPTLTAQLSTAPSLNAFVTQLQAVSLKKISRINLDETLTAALRLASLSIPGAADSFVKVPRTHTRTCAHLWPTHMCTRRILWTS
jgi:hypothetical protein